MKKLVAVFMFIVLAMTGCTTTQKTDDLNNGILTINNPVTILNENITNQSTVNPGDNLLKLDITLLNTTDGVINYDLSQIVGYDQDDNILRINSKFSQNDIMQFESGSLQPGQKSTGVLYFTITGDQSLKKVVYNDKDGNELSEAIL